MVVDLSFLQFDRSYPTSSQLQNIQETVDSATGEGQVSNTGEDSDKAGEGEF